MAISLEDRVAIEDLLVEVLDGRDRDGQDDLVADLFTEDGVLEHATGYKVQGRAAMLAHFGREGAPPAVHFTTNRRYDQLPDGRVSVSSYGITMADMGGKTLVVACITKDVVVRTPAGWRIQLHHSDALMRGQLNELPMPKATAAEQMGVKS